MARITTRIPMPAKMRAKQFMMFDAMKGLKEAIAAKERKYYPQKEFTEERIEEINRKLAEVQKGDFVSVSYYCKYGNQYRQLSGRVTKIDAFWKEIQIDNVTICFSEIDEISTERNK